MRGTFANVRLRNLLAPGTEGGVTVHLPDGTQTSIYEAAMDYAKEEVPLVVLAGREYGTGSSRDWAAKGTALLGVRAVIAQSLERIHRSNLIGMGVVPLQFYKGDSVESLGLTGHERYTITGLDVAQQGRAAQGGLGHRHGGRRLGHRVPGHGAHRHPDGGGVLPPRWDPPVRAAPDGGLSVSLPRAGSWAPCAATTGRAIHARGCDRPAPTGPGIHSTSCPTTAPPPRRGTRRSRTPPRRRGGRRGGGRPRAAWWRRSSPAPGTR